MKVADHEMLAVNPSKPPFTFPTFSNFSAAQLELRVMTGVGASAGVA
jgi:hypothetical protein